MASLVENTLLKIAKLLAKANFEKTLIQISKEINDDPDIQEKLKAAKESHDDLKQYITHLCKKNPWHHLCKDK